jgi:hypothetical protein
MYRKEIARNDRSDGFRVETRTPGAKTGTGSDATAAFALECATEQTEQVRSGEVEFLAWT